MRGLPDDAGMRLPFSVSPPRLQAAGVVLLMSVLLSLGVRESAWFISGAAHWEHDRASQREASSVPGAAARRAVQAARSAARLHPAAAALHPRPVPSAPLHHPPALHRCCVAQHPPARPQA